MQPQASRRPAPPAASAATWSPGRIGRGGMGMVYRGFDEALEREVAVKTLTAEGSLDEESRQRFEIEAKAAARLQHPNIVTVFELGEDRGIPSSPWSCSRGRPRGPAALGGAAPARGEARHHGPGLPRARLRARARRSSTATSSPSNMRLLDDGTAKIMDFGIAKLGGTHLTKTGMMVGTVHYMSPEQVRGQPLDGRSDVFSAGVILYELLAGQRPFSGEGADRSPLQDRARRAAAARLDAGRVAPRLQAVLARALAKDPDARFPSAAAHGRRARRLLDARAQAGGPRPQAVEAVAAARRRCVKEARRGGRARLRGARHRAPRLARGAARAAAGDARAQRRARARPSRGRRLPGARGHVPGRAHAARPPTPGRRRARRRVRRPSAVTHSADAPAAAGAGVLGAAGSGPRPASRVVAAAACCCFGAPAAPAGACSCARSRWARGPGRRSRHRRRHERRDRLAGAGPRRWRSPSARRGTATRPARVAPAAAGRRGRSRSRSQAAPASPVRTQPPGATVTVDGAAVAGTTPLEVALDPAREHRVARALDGHAAAGGPRRGGRGPRPVDVTLEALAPPGTVAVRPRTRSTSLARAARSPAARLAAGLGARRAPGAHPGRAEPCSCGRRHRRRPAAAARRRSTRPRSGKLNIRATPDNCQVFIDGAFVDYPPILDRPVAAGRTRSPSVARRRAARGDGGGGPGAPAFVIGPEGLTRAAPPAPAASPLARLAAPRRRAETPDEQARGLLEDGRAYRTQGKLKQALDNFNIVVSSFPSTDSVDDALLEIGRYRMEVEGDADKARDAFEQVTKHYPQSDGAPGAYYYLGLLTLERATTAGRDRRRARPVRARRDALPAQRLGAPRAPGLGARPPQGRPLRRGGRDRAGASRSSTRPATRPPPPSSRSATPSPSWGSRARRWRSSSRSATASRRANGPQPALERITALYRLFGGPKPAFALDPSLLRSARATC